MKKKLLIASDCFLPRVDGIGIYLKNLIPFLSKSFDVTVVAPDFPGTTPPLPARIVRLPLLGSLADIKLARWDSKTIFRLASESDIIFSNTIGFVGLCALRAAQKLKKPLVAHIHSYEWELFSLSLRTSPQLVSWLTRNYAKYFYRRAKQLIFPSREVQKAYQKIGVFTPSHIVPVKIPLRQFPLTPQRSGSPVIGYCGRLAREKGISYLLSAFEKLKKKQRHLSLLLVGDGLRTLKRRAKRLGAMCVGQSDCPQQFYPQMDIFVIASLTETTSIATMEAMCSGLPVVGTPVGKIKEFITQSGGGILVRTKNSKEIATAILRLINHPSECLSMGKKARQYALKKFDIQDSAQRIVSILRNAQF